MKKMLTLALIALMAIMALCACGGSGDSESADVDYTKIDVDQDAGTVSVYAKVNAMYIDQSTMHFVVFEGGNVAEKSMFVAFADSQDFYDALVEAGGKPGNETTAKLVNGEYIKGQPVEITMTWDGQDEPVAYTDVVVTGDGKAPVDKMVFGGNKQNNATAASGCLTCNNSCWAGIISNSAYAFGDVDAGNPEMFLNGDVVPSDGTVCKITYTLK